MIVEQKVPTVKDLMRRMFKFEDHEVNFDKAWKELKSDPDSQKYLDLLSIWRKDIIKAVKTSEDI